MMGRFLGSAVLSMLVLVAPSRADDEVTGPSMYGPRSILTDRHVFSVGIADQQVDAKIRATAQGFTPVSIDLDDLGVSNNDTSYYADYRYRFKPRWAVVAGIYSFNGAGGRTATRSFNFDGVEYEAGAAVRADFDIDAYIVDVMYSVHRGDSVELMLGGGIHALDLGATITGELNGGDENLRASSSGATLLAPVPNFRASGTWAATDRLTFHAVAGWLSVNIDEYSGDFVYAHLRAMYRFTDRVGVALGLQRTDIDVTQSRNRSELSFDTRLDGPTLTLTYSF